MNSAEPMPVPKVSTNTAPSRPRPAPKRISAMPAASASFSTVQGLPEAHCSRLPASAPIQEGCTWAAVSALPALITEGNPSPSGPWVRRAEPEDNTASMTAVGVEGCGRGRVSSAPARLPRSTSTGASLIEEPPTSTPSSTVLTALRRGPSAPRATSVAPGAS